MALIFPSGASFLWFALDVIKVRALLGRFAGHDGFHSKRHDDYGSWAISASCIAYSTHSVTQIRYPSQMLPDSLLLYETISTAH